jgi:hypothetical protein
MIQSIATWGTLAGTIATAIATVFLWRVTRILAVETKRMADAAAQPQVVVNIVPNQWSIIHLDIVVENTGNATAFDIDVIFDPPLENGKSDDKKKAIPFQKISVLKPGQALQSYLRGVDDYLSKSFEVTVRWKLHPASDEYQTLAYTLNMKDYEGVVFLGDRNPMVRIAQEVKKMREDWQHIASGFRRIKVETFDTADRDEEQRDLEDRFGRNRKKGETEPDGE